MLDLSIIIVSFNTRQLLKQCLQSLPANIEIIVVDNNSTDDSSTMVSKEFPMVKLVKNKKNVGFAKANNQGIKISQGKYVLLLNSDTVVPKQTISELIFYLEKNPQAGVITPRLELKNGQLDPACHRGFPTPLAALTYFLGLEKLFYGSNFFGQYHQTWKNLKTIHEINACSGAFLLTRKKILDQINGFDEKYFFYGEDLDLCYRIRQMGYQIIYYPKVKAIHYKGVSSQANKQTRKKSAQAAIEAMEIFYNKFYQDKYPRIITLLVILGIKLKKTLRLIRQ